WSCGPGARRPSRPPGRSCATRGSADHAAPDPAGPAPSRPGTSSAGRAVAPSGWQPRRRPDRRRGAPGGYPSAVTWPCPLGVSTSWVRSTLVVNVYAFGTAVSAAMVGIHGLTQPCTSSSRVTRRLSVSTRTASPPVVIVPINGVVVVVVPPVVGAGPVIVAEKVLRYASLGITRDRSI